MIFLMGKKYTLLTKWGSILLALEQNMEQKQM